MHFPNQTNQNQNWVDATLYWANELTRLLNGLIAIAAPFLLPIPVAVLIGYDLYHYALPAGMGYGLRMFVSCVGAATLDTFSVTIFHYIKIVNHYNIHRTKDMPKATPVWGYLGMVMYLISSGSMILVGNVFPAMGWNVKIAASFIPYGFLVIIPLAYYFMSEINTMRERLRTAQQVAKPPAPKPTNGNGGIPVDMSIIRNGNGNGNGHSIEATVSKPPKQQTEEERRANLAKANSQRIKEMDDLLQQTYQLWKEGKTNADIADEIGRAVSTVSRYKRELREKVGEEWMMEEAYA